MTLLRHLRPALRPAVIVLLVGGSLIVSPAVAQAAGGDGPRDETAKNAPAAPEVTKAPGDDDTKADDTKADDTKADDTKADDTAPEDPKVDNTLRAPADDRAASPTTAPAAPVRQLRAPVPAAGAAAKVIAPSAQPRSAQAPARRPAAPSGKVAPAPAPATTASTLQPWTAAAAQPPIAEAERGLPTADAQRRPTAGRPATAQALAVARPPVASGVRPAAASAQNVVLAASTDPTGPTVAPLLAGLSAALLLVLGLYATALRARRWLYDVP